MGSKKLEQLAGPHGLKGFQIVPMTEIYRIDDDGRWCEHVGVIKDRNVAMAFAAVQKDAAWHKTREVLILTDGSFTHIMIEASPAKVIDDAAAKLEARQKILAKLTPAERKALGFEK